MAVRIARDSRYQISNRFAWSWKLAAGGIPVVLVYLGFLHAADRPGWKAFGSHEDWYHSVVQHSESLFPAEIWNREWLVNGTPFVALIRSLSCPLVS